MKKPMLKDGTYEWDSKMSEYAESMALTLDSYLHNGPLGTSQCLNIALTPTEARRLQYVLIAAAPLLRDLESLIGNDPREWYRRFKV